jgi:8-oxo-dGTP pyrophosphatase MutT (NUDIX family)
VTDRSGEEFDPHAVPVRPAATVMLVRDHDARGLEVFMLRRTASAAFAASQYVFPGGRVDDTDEAVLMEPWCDGRNDTESSAVLAIPGGGLAFWVAAIRECFEEAGVLLARHASSGSVVSFDDPVVAARFSRYRHEVHGGTLGLGALCEREDLRLVTDAIGYVSHWITPVGSPRRFDARFFIARAPEAQEPLHDEHETVESLWVSPHEALDRYRSGTLDMFPPTVSNLAFLAEFSDADDALAAAQVVSAGPAPHRRPKVQVDGDGKVVKRLFPGDESYDSAPEYSVLDTPG